MTTVPKNRTFAAAAMAFACLLAAAAPDPAFANKCTYPNLPHDDGPCVEVKNSLTWSGFGSKEMNLWCVNGPKEDKIVLNPTNSFTCPSDGSGNHHDVQIQRTQAGCNSCWKDYNCTTGKMKLTLKLGSNGEFLERLCR